jgi:hypothetical protein
MSQSNLGRNERRTPEQDKQKRSGAHRPVMVNHGVDGIQAVTKPLNALKTTSPIDGAVTNDVSRRYIQTIGIRRLRAMSIRDRLTAPRSPWQSGYCERAIGSIRPECLDHVVVFSERHLRHLLRSFATYYNAARTHLSINKGAPSPRTVHAVGRILPTPFLGGLHHLYVRV